MKFKEIFLVLLFILSPSLDVFATNSRKSQIDNILYWANWISDNEYTRYEDYESELNFDTIDSSVDDKYEFTETEIYYTKKNNIYCTEIYLKGIKDRMLAMMQVEGSGWFPYLKIFRFDNKKQKWTIYYFGNGSLGECGLVYPIRDPITGYTFFFEEVRNFDNKRLISYDLLSFENKKWKVFASTRASYVYNLSDEEEAWISTDIIEKMAAFDYSFMGIKEDHPGIIEREVSDKKIIAKLYYTSVGYMPSNFEISIYKRAREVFKTNGKIFEEEKELLKINEAQWGFNIVEKNKKYYLMYIGMGNSGEPRVSTIESFMLNVLDLSTLEIVYRSYINCNIEFK